MKKMEVTRGEWESLMATGMAHWSKADFNKLVAKIAVESASKNRPEQPTYQEEQKDN